MVAYRRTMLLVALAAIGILLLAGCGGRQHGSGTSGHAQLQPAAVKESIVLVRYGVEEYRKLTGVFPIRNSTEQTPIYEKYVIDLRKLKDRGLISQFPIFAFENGGTYQYVLVNPDGAYEIKLMDVAAFQRANAVERAVAEYAAANRGALPRGDSAGQGMFRIDFAKLKGKLEPQTRSPYSGTYLPYVMNDRGQVAIDYAIDIAARLQKAGMPPKAGELDLRELLVADFPFVPVRSFPYRLVGNEPQPVNP